MSPQPTQARQQGQGSTATADAPAPDAAATTRPALPYAEMLKAIEEKAETDHEGLSGAERQIHRANVLERQRADLAKKITANRDYLRLMASNEELTDEQEQWLDDFYPQKEKGERRSQGEIERTRRAKEQARQDGGKS